ncbi:hypothetical protein BDR04DRAFT_1143784 [Suillus decipiens]|nr:hypothetical protein BDR04DRAFT_1143784 [Suillus decipiens]
MQLSVLFSALVSLAIFVTALPTPEAISKRFLESKKRDESDANGDGGGSSTSRAIEEREELESSLVARIGYTGDGGGSSISRATEEREELETNLMTYFNYGGCNSSGSRSIMC